MATLATVTTRVAYLLGSDASLSTPEIESVAATRLEADYETFNWSRRVRSFTISSVALVSSGTTDLATATNGSSTVSSAGTPWTTGMTGRQMRLGEAYQPFYITFSSSSEVLLHDGEGTAVAWPHDTASDLAWTVQQSVYSLPATADAIVSLADDGPLEEVDGGRPELDLWDDRRITTGTPTHWCYAGEDSNAARQIELWPVPNQARVLRGQFVRKAPTMTSASVIDLPVPLLVWGTAVDCCHLLHAKQGSSETMWSDKALFFERKLREVREDYMLVEHQKTSPPRSITRGSGSRRVGADYWVTHQHDLP